MGIFFTHIMNAYEDCMVLRRYKPYLKKNELKRSEANSLIGVNKLLRDKAMSRTSHFLKYNIYKTGISIWNFNPISKVEGANVFKAIKPILTENSDFKTALENMFKVFNKLRMAEKYTGTKINIFYGKIVSSMSKSFLKILHFYLIFDIDENTYFRTLSKDKTILYNLAKKYEKEGNKIRIFTQIN